MINVASWTLLNILILWLLYFLRINEQNNKSPLQSNNPLTCALPPVISFNYIHTAHRYEHFTWIMKHLLCMCVSFFQQCVQLYIKQIILRFSFMTYFIINFRPKLKTFPLFVTIVHCSILLFCPWNLVNVWVNFYQNFVQ